MGVLNQCGSGWGPERGDFTLFTSRVVLTLESCVSVSAVQISFLGFFLVDSPCCYQEQRVLLGFPVAFVECAGEKCSCSVFNWAQVCFPEGLIGRQTIRTQLPLTLPALQTLGKKGPRVSRPFPLISLRLLFLLFFHLRFQGKLKQSKQKTTTKITCGVVSQEREI